jgi:hypothetical protein
MVRWILGTAVLTSTGSTIIIDNSYTSNTIFSGGGNTYNTVKVEGTGNSALTITGDNTFNSFEVDASQAAKTVTQSGTQTVTNFLCPTHATNRLTLNGGTWVKAGGGKISLDYIKTQGTLVFSPADTWYLGQHSYIDSGTVSEAIFGSPGAGSSFIMVPMWPQLISGGSL